MNPSASATRPRLTPTTTRPNLTSRAARHRLTPKALAAFLPLAALPWLLPTTATAAPDPPAPPEAVWPLQPRPPVIRGFEQPAKPWLPGHRGLDLAGSPGQPVLSATAGTITYAGPLAGRGVIVVSRGPVRTTYEPVVPSIKLGAAVTPGTPLGTLSAAASHCAPRTCLHWGLLQSDTYLNPLTLLRSKPVRLLPLTPETTRALLPGTTAAQHDPVHPAAHPPIAPAKNNRPTPFADRDKPAAAWQHRHPGPAGPPEGDRPPALAQPPGEAGGTAAGPEGPAGEVAAGVTQPSGEGGGVAAGLVVAAAGVLTIGGALMIRRH